MNIAIELAESCFRTRSYQSLGQSGDGRRARDKPRLPRRLWGIEFELASDRAPSNQLAAGRFHKWLVRPLFDRAPPNRPRLIVPPVRLKPKLRVWGSGRYADLSPQNIPDAALHQDEHKNLPDRDPSSYSPCARG